MTPPGRDSDTHGGRTMRRCLGGSSAVLLSALLVAIGLNGASGSALSAPVPLVVMAQPGADGAAAAAVVDIGGRVTRQLGVINGFAASVPAWAVGQLAGNPAVASATPDGSVHLMADSGPGNGGPSGGTSAYSAASDPYSLYNLENLMGARSLWSSYTGAGVDVALVDSGVAPVEGLSGPGKVLNGPDLTEESQNPSLDHLDTFGHGTHMAGIIAGRDPNASPSTAQDNPNVFMGVAPNARIVSVKVADAHGNTDVSQVIAGVDWVVQHAHDPGLDIRVLNLSFGTGSSETYLLDPLAFAVEQAWLSGIVVVVSAGNTGTTLGHLTDPAIDPFVIAVGADDYHDSTSLSDDTVASFSSWGDGVRNPDLLAPGVHVQSLRDPGSYIDQTYGSTGDINQRFFRGSGTSQAAAMISGAAALLVQEHPTWTPDEIKDLLVGTAVPLPNTSPRAQGAGLVDLQAASSVTAPGPAQPFPRSLGTGTLEGSRGGVHLVLDGTALQGEEDIFGHQVDTATLAADEAADDSWKGGTWNGSVWTGSSWSGSSWSGSSWSGSSWSGSSWSGSSWSGSSWSGSSWSGSSWSAMSWSGSSWSGSSWSVASWS